MQMNKGSCSCPCVCVRVIRPSTQNSQPYKLNIPQSTCAFVVIIKLCVNFKVF